MKLSCDWPKVLPRIKAGDYLLLLAAIEATAASLGVPVIIEGEFTIDDLKAPRSSFAPPSLARS